MKTEAIVFVLVAGALGHTGVEAGTDLATDLEAVSHTSLDRVTVESYPYSDCFESASALTRVPMIVLLGVASGESAFDPDAVSRSRRTGREIAHGVMQIKWPETANELGFERKNDLYDPCPNIEAGARYLRKMLDRYDQSMVHALAAYNYGPGRIRLDSPLPDGARGYVRYILGKMTSVQDRRFRDLDSAPFYYFNTYYRADRFRDFLQRAVKIASAEYEVQKISSDEYAVTVRAVDAAGLRRAMAAISDQTGLEPMQREGSG
jgi:hypothetical protein